VGQTYSHFLWCEVRRSHYKAFQWLPLSCNIPTEVLPEVLAMTKPPSVPSCVLWVLSTTKPTDLQPVGLSSNTIHTTSWYIKTSLYHILSSWLYYFMGGHTEPGHTHISSWLYYFHGWSFHEPVLRFGYDNKPEAAGYNRTQP
jgi:hypothetical protein